MSFREMFLAENPIDGEKILEEARIQAAKGSALFDALEAHMKQAILARLHKGVMGLQRRDQISTHGKGLKFHAMQPDSDGKYVFYSDVLALITDLEKAVRDEVV